MQTRSERRTAEQWRVIVDEYLASEESIESFCEHRNMVPVTFRKWHRRFTAPDKPMPVSPAFVEAIPAVSSTTPTRDVVIHAGDITLRCPSDLGVAVIVELLRALRS